MNGQPRLASSHCGVVSSWRDTLLAGGLLLCLAVWLISLYGLVQTAVAVGREAVSGILHVRLILTTVINLLAFAASVWFVGLWRSRHLRLYRQIFERSNDAIAVIGEDGRYVLQNPAHRDLLGFAHEELAMVTPAYRAGDTDMETVESLRGTRQFSGEFRVANRDGHLLDIGLSCFTINNELGETLYYVEIKRDIGEHRKLAARIRAERERFETLSRTDFLTGLLNRHAVIEQIEREMGRAQRYGHAIALLMFDIDHFKRINDTYGHNVGDTVLCRVAILARTRLRETDSVARWGGEEFMVLLPETDEEAALGLAQSLRAAFADPSGHSPEEPGITCSFGVSVYRFDEAMTAWIGRTDAALYRAKHNGRNRVERASPNLADGGES